MADFDRIKRNIAKMVDQDAPETDIDSYLEIEGVTPEDLQIHGQIGDWRGVGKTEIDAKLSGLPDNLRSRAMDVWSKNQVTAEEKTAAETDSPVGSWMRGARERIQRVGENLPIIGGLTDEIDAGIASATGGGSYDAELSLARERQARRAEGDAEPLLDTPVGEIYGSGLEKAAGMGAGALAGPVAAPFSGGSLAANAGNMALTGALYGAGEGFGRGEGVADRIGAATQGGMMSAAAGAALAPIFKGDGGAARAAERSSLADDAATAGVKALPRAAGYGEGWRNYAAGLAENPISGAPLRNATRRAAAEFEESVGKLADDYTRGRATDPAVAGELVKRSLADWIDSPGQGVQSGADRAINAVLQSVGQYVPRGAVAPLANTKAAMKALEAKPAGFKPGAGKRPATNIYTPTVDIVRFLADKPGGATYAQLVELRSVVGARLGHALLDDAAAQHPALSRLYASLTKDMEAMVRSSGGPQAVAAWKKAQGLVKEVERKREALTNIIGKSGDRSAESVLERIVSMAGRKGSADIALLRKAKDTIGQDAWDSLAGAVLQKLGEAPAAAKSAGAEIGFSLSHFMTNLAKLSPAGKNALFAGGANAPLRARLNALERVGEKMKALERLANSSGTGRAILSNIATVSGSGLNLVTFGMKSLASNIVAQMMARPVGATGVSRYLDTMGDYALGKAGPAALKVAATSLAREYASTARDMGEEVDPNLISQSLMQSAEEIGEAIGVKGGDQAQALEAARNAIRNGKDRREVLKRLRDMSIDTAPLQ